MSKSPKANQKAAGSPKARNTMIHKPSLRGRRPMKPHEFFEGLFHGVDLVAHGVARKFGRTWERLSDEYAKRKLRSRLIAARQLLAAQGMEKNQHTTK